MNIIEIILIGLSLAMDAFTVSVCKGIKSFSIKNGIIVSFTFSLFQFIMPIIGFYLGSILNDRLINYNTYFSSVILIIIGILMIKENEISELDNKLNFSELFLLAIATSIDALVIGISFSFIKTNMLISAIIIGIITFIVCIIGFFMGSLFNKKYHQYSNYIGGITLIILGIKLLL